MLVTNKSSVLSSDLSRKKKSTKQTSSNSEVLKTIQLLKKYYPDAHCELNYRNPFELLISTILSAQCTDVMVNKVTKDLFAKYPTAESLAKAKVESVEKIIKATGFYKNKSKNIIECSKQLVQSFGGNVPKTADELISLAGVGKKTANVVLGNAYGIPSGVVVDTHVRRISNRFGWVSQQDPLKIEESLKKLVPVDDWILISHLLIFHGRRTCKARNPSCADCFLASTCPSKSLN